MSAVIEKQKRPPLTKEQRAKRMDANFRRATSHASAYHENQRMSKAITAFAGDNADAAATDEGAEMLSFVRKCARSLRLCSCKGLFSQPVAGGSAKFVMAHTCKHKVCNVCNWWRAKVMQRKWYNFFQSEEKDVKCNISKQVLMEGSIPVTRLLSNQKKDYSGREIYEAMDFMHLVLTVPHNSATGWNGKDFYAAELIEKFNLMRKQDWWLETVFAGEYTVEVSKNDSGLHIHLHVLLLVPKWIHQSRNTLAYMILKEWNKLTIDRTQEKKILSADRIEAIRRGYKFLDEDTLNNLILDLNATGATMVGIKSLYTQATAVQYARARSTQRFVQNGVKYVYCDSKNKDSMIRGIMECLKYHFKPCSFDDGRGGYDMSLLTQVLPNIFKKPLYRKFGAFHGVKSLNMAETPEAQDEDEITEALTELGAEAFNPDTLEDMQPGETNYMIVPMWRMRFNKQKRRMYVNKVKATEIIPPEYSRGTSGAIWYYMKYMVERRHGNLLENQSG